MTVFLCVILGKDSRIRAMVGTVNTSNFAFFHIFSTCVIGVLCFDMSFTLVLFEQAELLYQLLYLGAIKQTPWITCPVHQAFPILFL